MRIEDAPRPGWYPDPEGSARLRWWMGTDWSDRYRAPPTPGVADIQAVAAAHARTQFDEVGGHVGMGGLPRAQTEEIISQVREAARSEAERAAQLFGAQARAATRNLQPLISDYTSRGLRLIRRLVVLAVILVIAWFVFQAWANVTFFDWLGDRIDNITDGVLITPSN